MYYYLHLQPFPASWIPLTVSLTTEVLLLNGLHIYKQESQHGLNWIFMC